MPGATMFDFQPGSEVKATFGKLSTFNAPGYYRYYCSLHGSPTKGMVGAIRVVK